MSEVVYELTKGITPIILGFLWFAVIITILKLLFFKAEQKVDNIIDNITSEKCPKCGGNLEKKKGKYGYFIGCSNYPECRYTKNIK